MRMVVVPRWLKRLFFQLVWEVPTNQKKIYLTFDDGPTPEVTPKVLAFLRTYNAKATFFCLGVNAERYPDLLDQIRLEGHQVANHGYTHIDAWQSSTKEFTSNVFNGYKATQSKLFRPPYGHIWPWQYWTVKSKYTIVMWSVMPYDFDSRLLPSACLGNLKLAVYPGAIVVFHDTQKAERNLLAVLPEFMEWLYVNEFECATLPDTGKL